MGGLGSGCRSPRKRQSAVKWKALYEAIEAMQVNDTLIWKQPMTRDELSSIVSNSRYAQGMEFHSFLHFGNRLNPKSTTAYIIRLPDRETYSDNT